MSRKLLPYVRDVCRESQLTTSARALALLLASYSLREGECSVSQGELCDVLGVERTTVHRATRELERIGLVAVERSTMAPSVYRFPVVHPLNGVIPSVAAPQQAPVQHRVAGRVAARVAPAQRVKEGKEVNMFSAPDSTCGQCDGAGWVSLAEDSRTVTECDCRYSTKQATT